MKLLLASQNRGKIAEMEAIFKALTPSQQSQYTFLRDLQVCSAFDLDIRINVKESGQTYAENAALKASAFYQASQILTLADDSGLEVTALDGAPGLYSARYSPKENASDADRRDYLLQQLSTKPRPWQARFHCTIAIADLKGQLHYAEGNCSGEIIPEERGTHGFGYDPVFLLLELGQTMAELSMVEKNTRSHRARAILAALPLLEKIYLQNKDY